MSIEPTASDASRYSERSGPSVVRHGGRYLARGGATVTLEGDWEPDRLVVIEFESVEAARAWYDSDDYREIRQMREGAGEWRMVVVEGVRQPIDEPAPEPRAGAAGVDRPRRTSGRGFGTSPAAGARRPAATWRT